MITEPNKSEPKLTLEQYIQQQVDAIPGPYLTPFTVRTTKIQAKREFEYMNLLY